MPQPNTGVDRQRVDFMWLEITGKCQLQCLHCYAESGPMGNHGAMTRADWLRVIEQARELGVSMVQFIGGEPTLHPDFEAFTRYALGLGLEVEVYTNLVTVRPEHWQLFELEGVRLATSYYSTSAQEHAKITGAANSHRMTKANIVEALRRSIPLRVGLVELEDGQLVEAARSELLDLGVTDIGFDRLRQVGRGMSTLQASPEQLCGKCASGVMAVSPTGEVWPCVFSRWLPIGNVQEQSLAQIVSGAAMAKTRAMLEQEFASRDPALCNPCSPGCNPDWCMPSPDGSGCKPPPNSVQAYGSGGLPATSCHPCNPNHNCNPDCNPNCPPAAECEPRPQRMRRQLVGMQG